MDNYNEIKRPCADVVYSEKVKRVSDMKWAGSRHKAHTGICQFCNNPLPFAYRVFTPDGKCYEVTMESKGGAKAQHMIDTNSIPEGTHVFSLASCEVMCEGDVYSDGLAHYDQRAEEWKVTKDREANERARRAVSETAVVTAGDNWI